MGGRGGEERRGGDERGEGMRGEEGRGGGRKRGERPQCRLTLSSSSDVGLLVVSFVRHWSMKLMNRGVLKERGRGERERGRGEGRGEGEEREEREGGTVRRGQRGESWSQCI